MTNQITVVSALDTLAIRKLLDCPSCLECFGSICQS